MVVDRIKFSKEFFILGAGEWVTAYVTIEDNDPIWMECVKKVRQDMIGIYGEVGGSPTGQEETIIVDKPVKETRLQSIAESIKSCKDVKVLESYRLIAKAEKELQVIYDETYKKITA